MYVMFFFWVKLGSERKESPRLGSGDLDRLKEIFPDLSVIAALGEHREVGMDEVERLYRQLVGFYAANEVSEEVYQTGNFSGAFAVTSSLVDVFDDLIEFCEKELSLHLEGDQRLAIAGKQEDRRRRREAEHAKYRSVALEFLRGFPNLKPPVDETIRGKLEAKREEYISRKAKVIHPPWLAFSIDLSYRMCVYKIGIIDLLLGGQEVNPAEFCGRMFDEHGPDIDVEDLYKNALGVISIYLGTPLASGMEEKNLVQATI